MKGEREESGIIQNTVILSSIEYVIRRIKDLREKKILVKSGKYFYIKTNEVENTLHEEA